MTQPVWSTPAGSLGTYPSNVAISFSVSATAVTPATTITYILLSGELPAGITISSTGLISGTPTLVTQLTTSTFTIRATDNLGNLRDRTFSMKVSGSAIPAFITPPGNILSTIDSTWVQLPITYSNPDPSNPVEVALLSGILPPGIELTTAGVLHGYAEAPVVNVTLPGVTTSITGTTTTTNVITCLSTTGFQINRPIVFTGTLFGNIVAGTTYYIKSIINSTTFTISSTQDGETFSLATATGFALATLISVSVGQPTIRTYSFTLILNSPLGGGTQSYNMTIINQNTPSSSGGPGNPVNTRIPTILNTRPATFDLTNADPYYGYYVLPPDTSSYVTYPTTVPAFIGVVQSDTYFAFNIIGHDFDGNSLLYSYSGLPLGLSGDPMTGWITGTPVLSSEGINQYTFSVAAYKAANPSIQTPFFNFSFNLSNNIVGDVTWITPSNLGTIFNGAISTKSVLASAQTELTYRVVSGELPPNLTLLSNGEITGYAADQPSDSVLTLGQETEFTFTVQAFSEVYPVIQSTKTFTLTVVQEFSTPTDILYIKATPSVGDRVILNTLLENETLIPTNYLYRPNDVYFGKATSVIYDHAYGIFASNIDEYLAAVTRNHYWRNITLGEIETAVARNEAGEIIYEVVYSKIIDNLVNPEGVSISSQIFWPKQIDLGLGPWYASSTDIYTSYADILGQEYFTSLTPGYARTLYPNSLYNMRNRVADVLGQEFDSRLLPLWMTSQQADGSTLGYTQAWVICYTKPGYATTIKNNIDNLWVQPDGLPYRLNQINFNIDRFFVDKRLTYNYDKTTTPPAWTGLPSGTPVPDPGNSKDFYVLFPRQTILPDETQY